MGRAKHHHTTAKAYLRGFADEDELVTVRRRSGEERDLNISNVAVRSRFYDFHTSAGQVSGAVERWLAEDVESPVGPVLARLRDGASVDEFAVPVLAMFVATSLLRTPAVRVFMDSVDADVGPVMLANALVSQHVDDPTQMSAHEKAVILDAAFRAWSKRDQAEARRSQLRTVTRESDRLADRIGNYQWSVWKSDDPVLFTSDVPVSVLREPGVAWRGVIPAGAPVFLPVTPRLLLMGEPCNLAASNVLGAELVAMVNKETARHAVDQIIKHPAQQWPPDLYLSPAPPVPPKPTVTVRRSDEPSTFPASYPEVTSSGVRAVLDELEAIDLVE